MTRPLTPEALVYRIRRAADPQMRPNGRQIVYSFRSTESGLAREISQLWVCDTDGGNARQLTHQGFNNGNARWSPDGGLIAFTSDRFGSGTETGIFVLPVSEPGEAFEVTRHHQGVNSLAWSPDGARIAYTTAYDPENPGEIRPDPDDTPKVRVTRRVDYKIDGKGYVGDKRNHIWVVDRKSGAVRRLTAELEEHEDPRWSPDGRMLAIGQQKWALGSSRLLLIDADTGTRTFAWPAEDRRGRVHFWAWSPSGDRIVIVGSEQWTAQPNLFVLDVGTDQVRQLTDDLDIFPVFEPVWLKSPIGRAHGGEILLHAVRAGSSGLYAINSQSGAVELVERWDALHGGLSVDANGRCVVQSHASLEAIGEIAVYDLQADETRIITRYNSALFEESPPARWEQFQVQRGEFAIDAWLFMPPEFDLSMRYPLVVSIHGGPESYYGYSFHLRQQLLASNGFLVLAVNPRGSTSYGQRFVDAVLGDWGVEPLNDLLAALDLVLERPYADSERIGVCGASYGSFLTNIAIGRTDRFKAAVSDAVTFDLESQYLSADLDHAYGDIAWGGPPWRSRTWYDEQSPSSYAQYVTAPTLIMNGEDDQRTPIGQAEEMFVALKKSGCEVEFVRYPGGSHSFSSTNPPEHQVDYLQRNLAWFRRYLGGPEKLD